MTTLTEIATPEAAAPAGPAPSTDFDRDVVCLLGLPFDRATMARAQASVQEAIAAGARLHVATPNLNLARLAARDAVFRRDLMAADLSLADGMPLIWLARLLGHGLPQRAAGADLFEALGRERERAVRVFFFGGDEAVCAELRRRLGGRAAGVRCVGALAPGFGDVEGMSTPEIVARINAARPDLVAVAVSARKGLRWIARNEARLAAPVLANLGATIHFAAGTLRRAPEAWRRLGIEWLWRMREEPALWRRYAADFAFLARAAALQAGPALALRALDRFRRGAAPAKVQILSGDAAGRTLRLFGAFDEASCALLREALKAAAASPAPLAIDLTGVRRLHAAPLGLLLVALGHQARIGQPGRVSAAGWRPRLLLRVQGCGGLLDEGRAGSGGAGSPAPARPRLRPSSGATAARGAPS